MSLVKEPLKGKNFRNLYVGGEKKGEYYFSKDIKSAVEWLHDIIMKEFQKGHWVVGNMPLIPVKFVHDKIDEAFEDAVK